MFGGYVDRGAIAEPLDSDAPLADVQGHGGESGFDVKLRPEDFESGGRRADQHRPAFRLRLNTGGETAFLQTQPLLAVIRESQHRVSGDHDLRAVVEFQFEPGVGRHAFDGASE